jgi:hypothetical protein
MRYPKRRNGGGGKEEENNNRPFIMRIKPAPNPHQRFDKFHVADRMTHQVGFVSKLKTDYRIT